MCTLIVLHRCVPGSPLVVAANRDEFLDRPAEDFAVRRFDDSGRARVLCPLDLEAGGTWVGLSQRSVFAGLTNLRPLVDESDATSGVAGGGRAPKSRGGVVMTALEAESAAQAVRTLSELEEAAYNPFQLMVADERDAFLMVYRGRPRVVELEPGPHIVGNVVDEPIAKALGLDAREVHGSGLQDVKAAYPAFESIDGLRDLTQAGEPRVMKLSRVRSRVDRLVNEPGHDLFEGLARICREHVEDDGIESPFEATCVHIRSGRSGGPTGGQGGTAAKASDGDGDGDGDGMERYGTRSSLLLELSEDPGSSRLWTTDGAPCRRPFENRSSLLKDLVS